MIEELKAHLSSISKEQFQKEWAEIKALNLDSVPLSSLEKPKPYFVIRPLCAPTHIVIMATSKKDAINQSHSEFGYCNNTTAKLVKKRGTILSK